MQYNEELKSYIKEFTKLCNIDTEMRKIKDGLGLINGDKMLSSKGISYYIKYDFVPFEFRADFVFHFFNQLPTSHKKDILRGGYFLYNYIDMFKLQKLIIDDLAKNNKFIFIRDNMRLLVDKAQTYVLDNYSERLFQSCKSYDNIAMFCKYIYNDYQNDKVDKIIKAVLKCGSFEYFNQVSIRYNNYDSYLETLKSNTLTLLPFNQEEIEKIESAFMMVKMKNI